MKIGIDCRLWEETGVGRYIRNLVLNLQKLDKKNEYILFALNKDVSNIKHQVLSKNWRIVNANIRWHTLKEQLKFPQILEKENLDLMHFPYFSVPIFYKRPFVVTIHDLIQNHYSSGHASTLPFPFYHLKRIGYQKVLNHAVSKSKRIIVPLLSVKEDLIKILKVFGDKIIVTQEGFDPNIKKGKASESVLKAANNPYFLYVGNAYPHKNLKTLIKGFSNVKLGVNLILVGREDYFYKNLKEKKNSNLIFLHDISDSDLFYLYANSIAVVSASLMEGFGLIPLEALGSGAIPVVSDIPAFREVCDDAAIYFNPKDTTGITDKLVKAINLEESEKKEIKKKAEILLEKFSWQKMAKETLKIYESSIGV